ncbi:Sterol 3-beta-glucosyltransferase, partial [Penicillium capsulatum]
MRDSPSPDRDSGGKSPQSYAPYVDPELANDSGDVQMDGRVDVNLDSKIAKSLAEIAGQQEQPDQPPISSEIDTKPIFCGLKLNIVIQIVGSRGDVQPFIALGNALQAHGHRIRIATHDVFADFVRDSCLEFFPIGGDPALLMAYMVKNPGLIPQMKTLRDGEIKRKQRMVAEMLGGCWRSCIEDDPYTQEPFVADAIIANPPSFAHVHCAQALGIPVHLMFTMPWTTTKAFPHPLANLRSAEMQDEETVNWVSYGIVEWLTWQGLGDVINRWRSSIDLAPVPATEGPCLTEALGIPMTYCWSPALVPRPQDWPANIGWSSPVYIGFGSIVVDDPQKLINAVLEAVQLAGVRAIVSKGWSELSGAADPNIFYIGDCPHGWLFQHVAAVVHHGGAGTTACGLLNGRPTTIVPFFGDQPFWGNMVAKAGAGPEPIPHASLEPATLASAIQYCLTPEAAAAAQEIAVKMQSECGVVAAVNSFHRNLPLDRMRCSILPDQPAVWTYTKGKQSLHLSKTAVNVLIEHQRIESTHIKCYPINPIIIENRRWDPLTGVLSAATSTGANMAKSTGEMLYNPYKEFKRSRTAKNEGSSQDSNSLNRSSSSQSDPFQTAGNMAGAGLQGFGKFSATYFRGMVVDIPHAAAEGFRRAPKLYGEKPKDYGTVHDWKSGVKVGGKNFVGGMTSGVAGMITEPLKGALEDGKDGALRGLARGGLGMATKMPSAGIGLMAYPFHGISKSIESAFRTKTPKAIVAARLREGYAHALKLQLTREEQEEVIQIFDVLLGSMN